MNPTRRPPRGLFITGTCTEVGKTYVSCLIAKALVEVGCRVGVYKPAASGCTLRDGRLVADDAVALWEAAGRPGTLEAVCPQRFAAPLAPHLAAREQGTTLDAALLRTGLEYWAEHCDIVLVEGAGGLMSPISDDDFVADLALEFGYPLIVVAANRLGVINQTLQTLITACTFRDGIDVAGVVLNDVAATLARSASEGSGRPANAEGDSPTFAAQESGQSPDMSVHSNREQLETLCAAPILAHVPHGADRLNPPVDWAQLVGQARSA